MPEVLHVKRGSAADRAGVRAGDKILSVNGRTIRDILDWMYETSEFSFNVNLKKQNGRETTIEIKREPGEDLGIRFATPTIDEVKTCGNHCVFCFVDQNPANLRETLYVKDDDYRLSLLEGNFVTLTNVDEAEMERIINEKISPLYVSVHSTDAAVRQGMLRTKNAPDILKQLNRLVEGGIEIHCQIVLCPGLNDGRVLKKTINDLKGLCPGIASVAVVPVGLTRHRRGLFRLALVDKEMAKSVILAVETMQKKLLSEIGTRFVFLADEFYVKAGVAVPEFAAYEKFPQIENGVGLIRLFADEWEEVKHQLPQAVKRPLVVSIVSGEAASGLITQVAADLNRIDGLTVYHHVVKNEFFGFGVTVTGLLTGTDLIRELTGANLGQVIIIPDVMQKSDEDLFLDNLTTDDLEEQLQRRVYPVPTSAEGLVLAVKSLIEEQEQ